MPRNANTPADSAKQLMLESAIFLMRQSGLNGAATREILAHSKAPMGSWQATVARHLPMRNATRTRSFAGLVISAIEGGYIRGRAERSREPMLQAGEWLAQVAARETAQPAAKNRSPSA